MRTKDEPMQNSPRKRPPATTLESQENLMISVSMDLVEKRLREGTASSQETTHFLKLGSTPARLEREILEQEIELKKAKTEAIQSSKRIEELYTNALDAMSKYKGEKRSEEYD